MARRVRRLGSGALGILGLLGIAAAGCGGRLAADDVSVVGASLDAGIEDAQAQVDAPSVAADDDASSSVPPPDDPEEAGTSAPIDSAPPVVDADGAAPPAPDAAPYVPPPPPPPACAQPVAISVPTWKPPTAFHQAVCTAGEISTYTGCLGTLGCTSANATCDACLQTEASADAYGPVILGTASTDGFGEAFVNWGGCQANVDGHSQAGSCGSETNSWQACASEVCPYATCGSALNACDDYAYESVCEGSTESDACASEWASGTAVARCSEFETLATLWCGP